MNNVPPIEVDWTVDPKIHHCNSSPEFRRIASEVARLIKTEARSLLNGQVESVAALIVAQLAHRYGLAPRRVTVQSAESNQEGVLRGVFVWNDVAYEYEATPVAR